MTTKPKLEEVVYVSWEESEKGWGTRPDGCSLHLTPEDFQRFLKQYWNDMPKSVPDEYSRPAGNPVTAYANQELYKRIQQSEHGLRLWKGKETELAGKKELVYGEKRSGWVQVKRE